MPCSQRMASEQFRRHRSWYSQSLHPERPAPRASTTSAGSAAFRDGLGNAITNGSTNAHLHAWKGTYSLMSHVWLPAGRGGGGGFLSLFLCWSETLTCMLGGGPAASRPMFGCRALGVGPAGSRPMLAAVCLAPLGVGGSNTACRICSVVTLAPANIKPQSARIPVFI